jgi:DNA polymerase (family 10)
VGPAPVRAAGAAAILEEMADLLELRGELGFRVQAYRRAAEVVARSPVAVLEGYRRGEPPRLPGVGPGIAERLAEMARSGRLRAHEELRAAVPPSLRELLLVPGVGPRRAGEIWRTLGVIDLDGLRSASASGAILRVAGIGERGAARIAEALSRLESQPPRRWLLGQSTALAASIETLLRAIPGVVAATICGSVRRARETVGDIDVVVETDQPDEVLRTLKATPIVESEGEPRDGGERVRASLALRGGPSLDVMIAPPGQAGSYIVHLTGSARHNVRLRQRARERGWSLSEHGLARLGPEGQPLTDGAGATRRFRTEAELYASLGLEEIPPELREDRGEIEAAVSGTLPRLVRLADLQGDCHSHSDWSDGREPLEVMIEAARHRGYAYLVLTDHTRSLAVAGGLSPERLERQGELVARLNERFASEEARGSAPPGCHPDGFRILHGCELEIRADGHLDLDEALLSRLDVVVASLHVGRRQPRARLMERYRAAMEHPEVDVIAHPSGRRIGRRPDLDLDWDGFYRLAAETGTLLEVNGSEERLDLAEERIRAAAAAGCRFTIDSDAHDLTELDNVRLGVSMARRAWLGRAEVANALSRGSFQALMRTKPHRW